MRIIWSLFVITICLIIMMNTCIIIEPIENQDLTSEPTDNKSSSHVIETNMLYLNNRINELTDKYTSMEKKINKMNSTITAVSDTSNEASSLVGTGPISIDTTV